MRWSQGDTLSGDHFSLGEIGGAAGLRRPRPGDDPGGVTSACQPPTSGTPRWVVGCLVGGLRPGSTIHGPPPLDAQVEVAQWMAAYMSMMREQSTETVSARRPQPRRRHHGADVRRPADVAPAHRRQPDGWTIGHRHDRLHRYVTDPDSAVGVRLGRDAAARCAAQVVTPADRSSD